MTVPTPEQIGAAAAAAANAYGQAQHDAGQAEGVAQASAEDTPIIAGLQQQLATAQAQITDLQAQIAELTPPPPATIFGSGIGGWGSLEGGKDKSYRRITDPNAGFGPLKFIRDFDASVPDYIDPAAEVFLDPGGSVSTATLDQLQARSVPSYLSLLHEPERNASDPASWAKLQNDTAQRLIDRGYDNISLVPVLMGGPIIGRVQGAYTPEQWLADIDWSKIRYLGIDVYQWGHTDADADSIAHICDPVGALLTKLELQGIFAEFGVRRVVPPNPAPGISDALRANSIAALDAWCKAHPGLIHRVAYFESKVGQDRLVPWNLIGPPNSTTPYSPKALAAWHELCQR